MRLSKLSSTVSMSFPTWFLHYCTVICTTLVVLLWPVIFVRPSWSNLLPEVSSSSLCIVLFQIYMPVLNIEICCNEFLYEVKTTMYVGPLTTSPALSISLGYNLWASKLIYILLVWLCVGEDVEAGMVFSTNRLNVHVRQLLNLSSIVEPVVYLRLYKILTTFHGLSLQLFWYELVQRKWLLLLVHTDSIIKLLVGAELGLW